MAYFQKPVESMTEGELRACLANPRMAQHLRESAAMRLGQIRAQHDRENKQYSEHVKSLIQKPPRKISKPVGAVDARSVKHSAWNGLSLSGVTAAWAVYREAKEAISEMVGEVLSVTDYVVEVLVRMKFSDAEIVYISAAFLMGFMLTLAWKFTKEY